MSPKKIPRSELLSELEQLAEELGTSPERSDMNEMGAFSHGPYYTEFGSWENALEAAGLEPNVQRGKIEAECSNCGSPVKRYRSVLEDREHVFCGYDCLGSWLSKNKTGQNHHNYSRIKVECDWCSDVFKRITSQVEGLEHHFCCQDCMAQWKSEHESGEDSHAWKGGYPGYRGANWQEQRRRAIERDDFQCQICGLTRDEHHDLHDEDLHVHHLTPLREFDCSEAANKLENLLTVCRRCHFQVEQESVEEVAVA